jgi:hypothetical protein
MKLNGGEVFGNGAGAHRCLAPYVLPNRVNGIPQWIVPDGNNYSATIIKNLGGQK